MINQRRLWQLGTGQADFSSQSAPKKEMHKYRQEGVTITQNDGQKLGITSSAVNYTVKCIKR